MSSLEEFQQRFVKPKKGRTLIIGSKIYRDKEDRRKRYADAVGVDMLAGDGVDIVADLELPVDMIQVPTERPNYFNGIGTFDHVECMSTLEHSKRPWLMAQHIQEMMNPGATIFVSVPFCWRVHAYPDDYWRLAPSAVRSIFPDIDWQHVMLAADQLRSETDNLPAVKNSGHPYMARTETVAFGHKKYPVLFRRGYTDGDGE